MSIREQRSSPSTIEFKYSLSPTPSPSLPNISTVIDGIASALKSALYLLIAQLSAAHLKTNRMLGPVLRNIGQIFPYNDIRIVRPTDASWELSPFGTICIVILSLFLFFSKSTPVGKRVVFYGNCRGIIFDCSFAGGADDYTYAVSVSRSFTIYSCNAN